MDHFGGDTPSAGGPKPRLLLISATYAWEEPRKKLAALADRFELTCLTSREFLSALGTGSRVERESVFPSLDGTSEYRLVGLDPLGHPASTTRYLLRGLGRAVAANPADLILVESEPWAAVRWQSWQACRLHQPEAMFGEFSWENCVRTGSKGALLGLAYRAAIGTADFVITGNAGAGEIYRRHGLSAERLLVSPQLGIDEKFYRPPTPAERAEVRARLFGVPESSFLIGFAGRMEPSKGVPALLDAVEAVRARNPDADVRLCLMGAGTLAGELARRARGDAPWLRLLPPATHAEVATFMQGLDLFVLPSEETTSPDPCWKEQFGHVLIEAMACGTPALGSDSGAIPEVIGQPEMIFPWDQPGRLPERLTELVALSAPRRAEIARAQREHTLMRFTHRRLAAVWAAFMRERMQAAGAASSRACVLSDHRIWFTEDRPRRFLDNFEAVATGELTLCTVFNARDDEELQRKVAFLKTPRARALFSYALAPWLILASYGALRRAEFIYCEGPHYFWLLVILHRLGLFSMRGKRAICCLFFPHGRFEKKLALLNASPPVFRPFFITSEQIHRLETRGAAPGRIRLINWKIDAVWFHPAASPTRDFILCPGNIHRDDALVAALAGTLGLPLVRAGRMNYLREAFVPLTGHPGFRIEVNLDHHAYRRLVQNAALILLPIEPCDEPAGLTAALEALACRTPVLANASLGVGPLLENAFGRGCLLPDLDPENWRSAVSRTLARSAMEIDAQLDAGRQFIVTSHAIASEKQDWRDFTAQATF